VRLPNPRLVRLAGMQKGAIVEKGDAELVLSPLVQPIIELAAPVAAFPALAVTQEDSFITGTGSNITGIQAGVTTVLATLNRGVWILELYLAASIVMVTNQGILSYGIRLLDPAGAASVILLGHNMAVTHTLAQQRRLQLAIQTDLWVLQHVLPATANAGDAVSLSSQVNARRLM